MKFFQTTYRVIYGDVDSMKVAYYANYLRWFEIGRTELIRQAIRGYFLCVCLTTTLYVLLKFSWLSHLIKSYYHRFNSKNAAKKNKVNMGQGRGWLIYQPATRALRSARPRTLPQ